MAEEIKKLQVNIEGKDNTSKAFKSASQNANLFTKEVGTLSSTLSKLGGAVASLYALGGLADFMGGSIEEYDKKIQYATKLEYLLKKTTEATQEEVNALFEQSEALQQLGVISDDVIVALQGQLATFELSSDTIRKMTPAIADMIVAEKGINATTEEMIEFGNAFGMAMEGNYASLTRRGFKLDENTKKIIELGTEEQKADAITRYLTDTYGGLNEAMRKTSQGELQNLRNNFGDFREELGALLSFFKNDFVMTLNSIDFSTGFAKNIAKFISDMRFGLTNLGDLIAERVDTIFGLGINDSEAFYEKLNKYNDDFEQKWANIADAIVTPTSSGGDNPFPDLEDDAEKLAKTFTELSKEIVSSFNKQTDAISDLRKELSDLENDTQEQLSSAEKNYQKQLTDRARQSKERIENIDKEIEAEKKSRGQGWRTRIADLEAEKEKEKAIIAKVGGEVNNLNDELAKDELQILKDKYDEKRSEILSEAEKTKAEKEAEISDRTGAQLRSVIASLSPEYMSSLIEENRSFLGQIGAGVNENIIINFNGNVNDKDTFLKLLTDGLNRQAELRNVAGK